MRSFLIVVSFLLGCFCTAAFSQDNPFNLAPGETLIAVDGVPVAVQNCPNGRCQLQRGTPVRDAAAGAVQGFSDGLLQMKANSLARTGLPRFHVAGEMVVGARYEGLGMGRNPQEALSKCCGYGRRPIVGSAVACDENGVWYAVVQYR